jgi:hypothetical protein
VKDGKDYIDLTQGVADRGAATIIDLYRKKGHQVPEPSDPDPVLAPVVKARLNHGRWIGDCGLPDAARQRVCLNAQYVDPDDTRFFCVECHNADCGGAWRPVLWPADRAAVEAPLEGLPAREQNWTP